MKYLITNYAPRPKFNVAHAKPVSDGAAALDAAGAEQIALKNIAGSTTVYKVTDDFLVDLHGTDPEPPS